MIQEQPLIDVTNTGINPEDQKTVQIQNSAVAKVNLEQATANPMSAMDVGLAIDLARRTGRTQAEVMAMTNEERDRLDKSYWLGNPSDTSALQEKLAQSPQFASIASPAVKAWSGIERFVLDNFKTYAPGDKPRTAWESASASAASGLVSLSESMPFVGSMGRLEKLGKDLALVNDIIANTDENHRLHKRAVRARELTLEQLRYAWDEVRHTQEFAALNLPVSDATEKFQKTEGLGEAVGAFITGGPQVWTETALKSVVSQAPTLITSAIVSIVNPALGAAVMAGGTLDSSYQTKHFEYLEEEGATKDGYESLKNFYMTDPDAAEKIREKAWRYAVVTSAAGAASFRLAGHLTLPKQITSNHMPGAARVYNNIMAKPLAYNSARFMTEGAGQVVADSTGEALGQLTADNKITSWSDVVAEGLSGAVTSVPEIFKVVYDSRWETSQKKKAEEARQRRIQELAERKKEAINGSGGTDAAKVEADDLINRIQQSQERNPGVDLNSYVRVTDLSQEQVDILKKAAPHKAEEIDKSIQTGKEVAFSLNEHVNIVAFGDAEAATLLKEHSHSADGMTAADYAETEELQELQIQDVLKRALDGDIDPDDVEMVADADVEAQVTTDNAGEAKKPVDSDTALEQGGVRLNNPVGGDGKPGDKTKPEFEPKPNGRTKAKTKERRTVANSMFSAAMASGVTKTEANAVVSVLLPLLDTMSKETGISLSNLWNKYQFAGENKTDTETKALGRIAFPRDGGGIGAVITRFKGANKSTFIHEGAHWYLEVRANITADIEAKIAEGKELTEGEKDFLKKNEAIEKHIGANMADVRLSASNPEKRTQQHEAFARKFEAYLMTGSAPTNELRNVFRQFKNWMLKVYQFLRNIPGIGDSLPPDTVATFDALFVAREQAAEVIRRRQIQLATDKFIAKLLGHYKNPGDKEFDFDKELMDVMWDHSDRTRQEVMEDLTARGLQNVEALTKRHNQLVKYFRKRKDDQLAALKRDVLKSVLPAPAFKIYEMLNTPVDMGKRGEDGKRVIREKPVFSGGALKAELARLGIDNPAKHPVYQRLKDYGWVKNKTAIENRGGVSNGRGVVSLETLAFGSEMTVQELVDMIAKMPVKKDLDAQVEETAAFRLQEREPHLSTEGAIREAVDKIILDETMQKTMTKAIGSFMKSTGRNGVAYDEVKRVATQVAFKERIGDMRVRRTLSGADAADRDALRELRGYRVDSSKSHSTKADGDTPLLENGTDSVKADKSGYAKNASVAGEREARAIEAKRRSIYLRTLATVEKEILTYVKDRLSKITKRFNNKREASGISPAMSDVLVMQLASWGLVKPHRDLVARQMGSDESAKIPPYDVFKEETNNRHYNDTNKQPYAYLPEIPEILRGKTFKNGIKDMTGEEAMAAIAFAENYDKAAKLIHEYDTGVMAEDLTGKDTEIAAGIEAHAVGRGMEVKSLVSSDHSTSWGALRKYLFGMMRIPAFLRMMEGKDHGFIWEYVVKPLQNAHSAYETRMREMTRELFAASKALRPLLRDTERKYRPALGIYATGEQVLMFALNMGNAGNMQRLIDGSVHFDNGQGKVPDKPWTKEQLIQLVSEELTAEQLNAIQDIWNEVGSLYPEFVIAYEKRYKVIPPKVEALGFTVTSSDGKTVTMRGGYFPIMEDKLAVTNKRAIDAQLSATYHNGNVSVNSSAGHARGERGTGNLLSTRFSDIFGVMDDMLRDLYFGETLTNVNRIFSDGSETSKKIKKYWGGEAFGVIRTWIEDIAAGGRNGKDNDAFANWLRSGISVAYIAGNLKLAVAQLTGIGNTIAVLGPKGFAKGFMQAGANPVRIVESYREAARMSPFMASRSETYNREMSELSSQLYSKHGEGMAKLVSALFKPITWTQGYVDIITWWGAYDQALESGCSQAEAVARADQMVRDCQGSGSLIDLSGYERGNAWQKLFTIFYSFFNTALNAIALGWHTKEKTEAVARAMMLVVVTPIFEAYVRSLCTISDEDEEEWEEKMYESLRNAPLQFGVGMIFGIREVTAIADVLNYAISGEGVKEQLRPNGLMLKKITAPFDLIKDITKAIREEDVDLADTKAAKDLFDTVGLMFSLPSNAAYRTLQGAYHLANGDTSNPAALLFGFEKTK